MSHYKIDEKLILMWSDRPRTNLEGMMIDDFPNYGTQAPLKNSISQISITEEEQPSSTDS